MYSSVFYYLTQRSGNIQSLIKTGGFESLSTDQLAQKLNINKGSLKGEKATTGATASVIETEVSKLSPDDFMEWLMRKGYSIQDCQAFRGK